MKNDKKKSGLTFFDVESDPRGIMRWPVYEGRKHVADVWCDEDDMTMLMIRAKENTPFGDWLIKHGDLRNQHFGDREQAEDCLRDLHRAYLSAEHGDAKSVAAAKSAAAAKGTKTAPLGHIPSVEELMGMEGGGR